MTNNKDNKRFVLSLGGSLIVPNNGIDTTFLKKFEKYIREKVAQGYRFFIVTGGGATARQYRDGAEAVCGRKITNDDMDWLAIHVTRLNGHLLRTIFKDIAHKNVIKDYDPIDKEVEKAKVVIGAGWKPGWSTDYDAVLFAKQFNIETVVNLSNIDMVYDKDPKEHKDAKPIEKISWKEMVGIVGEEWTPCLNMPFDPIASKLAMELGLKAVICNGKDLNNLDNIIEGKEFTGTTIE